MSKTLIIFGSTTGNTEAVAEQIKTEIDADMINASEAKPEKLATYENLIFGSSTWDEGELQYDMADFMEKLETVKPDLSNKNIFIFSLGDKYYEFFCKAGEVLKSKLESFGAQISLEILKIDGMPDEDSNQQALKSWITKVQEKLT